MRVSWDQVLAWRLRRHLLEPAPGGAGTSAPDAVDVVRRLCGVQAQVLSAAELAVAVRGARSPAAGTGTGAATAASTTAAAGAAPSAVAAALVGRRLLRTWAMRGTLHVLTGQDAGAYLALVAAARTWERSSWQRTFATAAQLAALADVVVTALDGRSLTREELAQEVGDRSGDPGLRERVTSGWGAVLKPLAWQGLLCQGDPRGNRVTFTTPASHVPGWQGLPGTQEAARRAVPAYLAAHGPASPETFDRWLTRGLSRRAAVRAWFGDLDDALASVEVEGTPLLLQACDVDELAGARPSEAVRLLPAFDQWLLGPGTGDEHVVPPSRRTAVSRQAGWIAPVVVVGGRVRGTWQLRPGALDVQLFADEPAVPADALEAEADRVCRAAGVEVPLAVSSA